jgi:hypothetical protein
MMPIFTIPIHEHGTPGEPNYPHEGAYARKVRHQDDALAQLKAVVSTSFITGDKRRDVPSPVSTRAAVVVAAVLKEMQAKGYRMPERVDVGLSTHTGPHGAVHGIVIRDMGKGEQLERDERHLSIGLPDALPDDADLDDAVKAVFSEQDLAQGDPLYAKYDRFTARTLKDVIVHEIGHVQAGHRGQLNMAPMLSSNLFPSTAAIRQAMQRVSRYASTSADEFLAEAFTRLYRGETLAEDSMKLYRALRGPQVH